ncbi:MAG: hypothetical protein ACKPKO_65225, partial [Candidatus Fonsibacter sp.]
MVGSVALIAVAAKAIPKASGMQIVSCSSDELFQQRVSVTTDGSTVFNWMLYFFFVLLFLMSSCNLFCRFFKKSKQLPQFCNASTQTEGYEQFS